MIINARDLYKHHYKRHVVDMELFIPVYPNITEYRVNVFIENKPPYFLEAISDFEMGLY
jgi:hypothetical protein